MKEMTMNEFANKIISMPADKKNEFFENLKAVLSEEEWTATVKFVSLFGMFHNPKKYEAMKTAVCDQLCEEIYGHTVEKERKTENDVLISMYSNSIL